MNKDLKQAKIKGVHLEYFISRLSHAEIIETLGEPKDIICDKSQAHWEIEHQDGRQMAIWDWQESGPVEQVTNWSAFGSEDLIKELFPYCSVERW